MSIIPSLPFTFINGTVADATQVDANFTTVVDDVNANAAHNGVNSDITELLAVTVINISGSMTVGGPTDMQFLHVEGNLQADQNINMDGTGDIKIPSGTTGQRSGSPVNGMMRFNTDLGAYECYGPAGWTTFAGSAPATFGGRLSLDFAFPVMVGPKIAHTTVYYVPYNSGFVPVWTGSAFVPVPFTTLAQALSDTTLSPAAAAAASVYDMFVWNHSGTMVVSRGPAWSNATTRGYSLALTQGVYVNPGSITNGPAAGYGVYVGTIMTDNGGATCTFDPTPVGAPAGAISWVGVWNMYNRVNISGVSQDTSATWSVSSGATFGELNASADDSVNFVAGIAEDFVDYSLTAVYDGGTNGALGIGFNSTTTPQCIALTIGGSDANLFAAGAAQVVPGYNFLQALQAGTCTLASVKSPFTAQAEQLTASWRY